ncbi:hypothetical protein [Desulfosarcina cetonica]|uniref:hypothetical protein n=1 Tax=Desulfosarcina cetonica TaxID=90730 RepID=UPI00155DAB0A|nr:hypothetical protein [Desulfosarcina cetonica]
MKSNIQKIIRIHQWRQVLMAARAGNRLSYLAPLIENRLPAAPYGRPAVPVILALMAGILLGVHLPMVPTAALAALLPMLAWMIIRLRRFQPSRWSPLGAVLLSGYLSMAPCSRQSTGRTTSRIIWTADTGGSRPPLPKPPASGSAARAPSWPSMPSPEGKPSMRCMAGSA